MDIVKRFLNYTTFETTSFEDQGTRPSNPLELKLLEELKIELKDMGIESTLKDGFLYAFIKSDCSKSDTLFLMAHVDTSSDASGRNVKARVVHYEGGDIELGNGKVLSPLEFETLENHIGHDLIVTDGTTLLGADDKAGIAIIMDYLEIALSKGGYPNLCLCFSSDEEIGEGTRDFDIDFVKANCPNNIYAYTLDGGDIKEFNYETFNASAAKVKVNGLSVHPGSAFNKMINASEIVQKFHSLLPKVRPENTSGRRGFIHITSMESKTEYGEIHYILRSFDKMELELFKKQMISAQDRINEFYNKNIVEVEIKDQYSNMLDEINKFPSVIEFAHNALKANGIDYIDDPIRGGTDGAHLSFMGLPCPNLGTGGENYHGIYEYLDIDQMKKMVDVVTTIASYLK